MDSSCKLLLIFCEVLATEDLWDWGWEAIWEPMGELLREFERKDPEPEAEPEPIPLECGEFNWSSLILKVLFLV